MWKKGAFVAIVAALIVVAITLLQGVSSSHGETSAPIVAKPVERTGPPPIANAAPSTSASPAAIAHEREPATSGPAASVWKVMGTPHANPAEEREALVAALHAAPACLDKWCNEGRSTLAAWQTAITAKVPGVTASAAECSAAGCWTEISVTDPRKWRDVSAALPDVTAATNWPGPSIQGGPDFQTRRGAVVALWAILPNVTDNSEKEDD